MRVTLDWIEAHHLELYAGADYGWFAHALQTQGDHAQARAYVDRALRRAAHGDPMGEATAYRVLARLHAAEGADTSPVETCLEQATRAGEARGSRHELVKTQLLRAELCGERGDPESARRWADASRTAARELGMPWHLERAEQLLASSGAG
jgi:ATP/maltotriose-dependent transcriptional regulator MalT